MYIKVGCGELGSGWIERLNEDHNVPILTLSPGE